MIIILFLHEFRWLDKIFVVIGAQLDKEQTVLRKDFKKAAASLINKSGSLEAALELAAPVVDSFKVGQATKDYMTPYIPIVIQKSKI